jgi:ankyrin repeat protein
MILYVKKLYRIVIKPSEKEISYAFITDDSNIINREIKTEPYFMHYQSPNSGDSFLHMAIKQHKYKIAKLLIKNETIDELMMRNKCGDTPIALSIFDKDINILQELLQYGIPINSSCDMHNDTPLQLSAGIGNPDITRILIDHNADVNLGDKQQQQTAIQMLINNVPIDKIPELSLSGNHNNVDYVKTLSILLDHGADVNSIDLYGESLLHLAVLRGNKDIVSVLLKYHASSNMKDQNGQTPLDIALKKRSKDMIQLLK